MERDLQALAREEYDVLVVGGGVVGACVARDAALRGLKVALCERQDFAHATSAASSKLIHGGLRYLANLEFRIVRESLRERRHWEVIAPHLVYPIPWLLPIYEHSANGRFKMRAGLTLYDLLGFDRNQLDDDDQKIPAHRAITPAEVADLEPDLPREGLLGAMRYFDCQMFSPERLALECILDAVAHGAKVANHAEVTTFARQDGRVCGANVRDLLGGNEYSVNARITVNATGPWADHVLQPLEADGGSATQLIRSKGIHVITRRLTRTHAVAGQTRRGHLFILPWRDHSIIGTTDTVYDGAPDDFCVTEQDVEGLLETAREAFPHTGVERGDVLGFYGGMRPLVEGPKCAGVAANSYKASRRAEVRDHAKDSGTQGLLSAIGGKWTTARALAQQVIDLVERKLERTLVPCRTHEAVLPGGDIGRFASYEQGLRDQLPELSEDVVHNLARVYGSQAGHVVALAADAPELAERLSLDLPQIGAQIVHAVRHEMARTLEDAALRRTGLGTLGPPGAPALRRAAQLIGRELQWSADEQRRQVAALEARYTLR